MTKIVRVVYCVAFSMAVSSLASQPLAQSARRPSRPATPAAQKSDTAASVQDTESLASIPEQPLNPESSPPESASADSDVESQPSRAVALTLDSLIVEGLYNPEQASMVRRQTGLRTGQVINSQVIQSAIKRLYSLGLYKSVDFLVQSETDSSATLVLKVQEFPILESVEYVGIKKLRKEDIEEGVALKKGQSLSDAALHEAVRTIQKKYAEKGFVLAEVTPELIPTKVPGNVIAKLKIKENAKVQVKEITFKGNSEIKENRLKRRFKTKERKALWGGDFDQEQYRSHLDSLVYFYNDEGYLDAEIVRDTMWYGANGKDIYIEIELNEGRRYYTGDFFFTGNKVLQTPDLASQLGLKKGRPFSKSKFEMTKEGVANRYREEGYLWVGVNERRAFREDTIDVTFEIVEGRPAIVRKIDIIGNEKTAEKVIRREIGLMPGQKYRQSVMMRSVRDVMQLNFFSNVNPDLRPNEDGTVDFVFDITEKDNIGQLSVGAAYSRNQGLVGTFQIGIPNFRGLGQELNLNTQYGKDNKSLSIGFQEPWAFDTPTRLGGQLFFDNTQFISGEESERFRSYGFRVNAGRKLKWPDDYFYLRGDYELSYQDERIQGPKVLYTNPEGDFGIRREGLLSKLSLTLLRNDTDIPMFPTRGSIMTISPEIAGIGGDFSYLKGTVGVKNYFPLFWKFVLGTEAKAGLIHNVGNWPISISRQSLFQGGGVYGADVVNRGYGSGAFGGYAGWDRYASTHNRDGIAMLSLNADIRFPIIDQQLYISAFADMGNTWSSLRSVDLRDLNKSVGVGFRLMVPMLGLLGFDVGWGLDNIGRDGHFNNGVRVKLEPHFIMNRGF